MIARFSRIVHGASAPFLLMWYEHPLPLRVLPLGSGKGSGKGSDKGSVKGSGKGNGKGNGKGSDKGNGKGSGKGNDKGSGKGSGKGSVEGTISTPLLPRRGAPQGWGSSAKEGCPRGRCGLF